MAHHMRALMRTRMLAREGVIAMPVAYIDEKRRSAIEDLMKEITIYLRVIPMQTAVRADLIQRVSELRLLAYQLGESEALGPDVP